MKLRYSPADRQAVFAIASRLLQYPDEELMGCLDDMDSLARKLSAEPRRLLGRAVARHKAIPLLRLQAEYVETFDLRGRNCLYLTYLRAGDTRNRGMALWRFGELYHSRGYSLAGGELPDYLPAMLELAAQAEPDDDGPLEMLCGHRAEIAILRSSLVAAESPYAGILRAIETALPKPERDVQESVRRLVEAGPPAEELGLEPDFDPEAFEREALEREAETVEAAR